jgi:hypothetical protein
MPALQVFGHRIHRAITLDAARQQVGPHASRCGCEPRSNADPESEGRRSNTAAKRRFEALETSQQPPSDPSPGYSEGVPIFTPAGFWSMCKP